MITERPTAVSIITPTIPREETAGAPPPRAPNLVEPIAPERAPTPTPAPATDDDDYFSGDGWDDGDGDGLLHLAGFAPEEEATTPAAPARQRDERHQFGLPPQSPRAPRLDDVYRLAQERRQADSDLDWALRLLGQRPQQQPQEAPTAQQPGAAPAPQQPRRTVRRLQRDAEGNITGIEEAEEPVAPPAPPAAAPGDTTARSGALAPIGIGASWLRPQQTPAEFAASSRWWGGASERVWSFVHTVLQGRRAMLEDIAARSQDPEQGRDPVQDWLERKVQENIADAQQRQREADEIAAGTRPGPQSDLQTELGRATARGLVTTTANTLKGAAYGYQYARRGTMSEAAETKIYELAAVIDEWAR
jgi:hypothetical protein